MKLLAGVLAILCSFSAFAIRSGDTVSHFNQPYLVKIKLSKSYCSGYRISFKYFITAAHCLTQTRGSSLNVSYMDDKVLMTETLYKTNAIIKSFKKDSEIAVFKINPTPTNDIYFKKPEINFEGFPPGTDRTGMKILGFGTTQTGRMGSARVGYVNYQSTVRSNNNDAFMYKVRPGSSNQIACPGDSGGPLLTKTLGVEKLVGIVSYITSPSTNNMHKLDIKKQCQKAEYAYYIALKYHKSFLTPYL